MSIQRHDLRTRTGQKYGKPNVTYPYGDLRFPRIVESRTVTKGPNNPAIPFLTPHRDQRSYPGAVLIEQASDAGDDTEKNVTETYEILPGPWTIEVDEIQDTGVPILIGRRKVAMTADYQEGEFVPATVDVASISLAGVDGLAPGLCLVTLTGDHELPPRAWVTFDGTDSTPALYGPQRIVSVPAENQVIVAANVTTAGTSGTMRGMNRIIRELKPTANVNILMNVESMIAVPDVTVFNEDIPTVKEYSFPDVLTGLTFYRDESVTDGGSLTEYSLSITGDGSVLPHFQNGYRGQCQARRKRLFSSGPPADDYLSDYVPTFVMPSSGSYAVKAQSISYQVTTSGTATGTSYTFKAGSIPPCISAGHNAVTDTVGSGQANCTVRLPPSTPTGFGQGEIITLLEEPQKLGAALWQTIVWQLTVPYTSGLPPADFTYAVNPAIYTVGFPLLYIGVTVFVSNNPTGISGASAWGIAPSLPSGLSLNSSTGEITGTPSATAPYVVYTVTCVSGGAGKKGYLALTVN